MCIMFTLDMFTLPLLKEAIWDVPYTPKVSLS